MHYPTTRVTRTGVFLRLVDDRPAPAPTVEVLDTTNVIDARDRFAQAVTR